MIEAVLIMQRLQVVEYTQYIPKQFVLNSEVFVRCARVSLTVALVSFFG